jgi:hypothetical protein
MGDLIWTKSNSIKSSWGSISTNSSGKSVYAVPNGMNYDYDYIYYNHKSGKGDFHPSKSIKSEWWGVSTNSSGKSVYAVEGGPKSDGGYIWYNQNYHVL